jgi:hypothetical protein
LWIIVDEERIADELSFLYQENFCKLDSSNLLHTIHPSSFDGNNARKEYASSLNLI